MFDIHVYGRGMLPPNKNDIADINALLRRLRGQRRVQVLDFNDYAHFLQQHNMVFAIAREQRDSVIIGMATMFFRTILSGGKVAYIDDVVVERYWEGKGVATSLDKALRANAQQMEVRFIDLTSSPNRKKANAFYKKRGYQKRRTNVYRLSLKQ